MINLSIVGLGAMGQNHLRVLSRIKDVNIKYIVDKDLQKIKDLGKKYNLNFTTSLKKALDCSDTIVISTPTTSHFNIFMKCAQKARNIFIEKPISSKIFEIKMIKKKIEENNINLHCGFIERYGVVGSVVKKIIKSKVIFSQFVRTNKTNERALDVDVIDDLMIHDIDLAINLFGKITETKSYGYIVKNKVVHACVIARHENGFHSQFLASKVTEKKERLVQITTKNNFIEANLLSKEVLIYKNSLTLNKIGGYLVSSNVKNISSSPVETLQLQHEDFISMCNGKENKSPSVHEALEVAKVINLIKINLYAKKKYN